MASFPVLRPSATLTLTSCFPPFQLWSCYSLGLSPKGSDKFLLIDFAFYYPTGLPSEASNSFSFLFWLLQEYFAIIDNVVMNISFSCTDRFSFTGTEVPVGSLNLSDSTWMYTRVDIWWLSQNTFFPNITSCCNIINMDYQSWLKANHWRYPPHTLRQEIVLIVSGESYNLLKSVYDDAIVTFEGNGHS